MNGQVHHWNENIFSTIWNFELLLNTFSMEDTVARRLKLVSERWDGEKNLTLLCIKHKHTCITERDIHFIRGIKISWGWQLRKHDN